MGQKLTIGELARRSGVPVKTLRFYSDEGLLPPAGRTSSGYRLYTEEHALRLDLIRALREAGVGLSEIGQVLRHELTLEQVLVLHLGAVEAHIAALQRIAAALRLAIEAGATEEQVRRLTVITNASNEDRRNAIAAFYEKVIEGLTIDRQWVDSMIDASAPSLPTHPSAEQLAAWVELKQLLDDPTFVDCKRVNAADVWDPQIVFDDDTVVKAREMALTAVSQARLGGADATSDDAAAIVDGFMRTMLAATTHDDAAAVRAQLCAKYDPRGARYWELVAIMRGDPEPARFDDWRWFGQALRCHG